MQAAPNMGQNSKNSKFVNLEMYDYLRPTEIIGLDWIELWGHFYKKKQISGFFLGFIARLLWAMPS